MAFDVKLREKYCPISGRSGYFGDDRVAMITDPQDFFAPLDCWSFEVPDGDCSRKAIPSHEVLSGKLGEDSVFNALIREDS